MRGLGNTPLNTDLQEAAFHQGIFNNPTESSSMYQPLREVADGSLGAFANPYQDKGMTRLRGVGDFSMATLDMKSLVIGASGAFLLAYLVWGRKR